MNKKITATILTTILSGSVYAGTEMGRPDCDYVVANQQEEICLDEKTANAIIQNFTAPKVGFGSIPFGGEVPILKEK